MTQQSEEKTLRDEFAMAALIAIGNGYGLFWAVELAYKYADEMMEARKK